MSRQVQIVVFDGFDEIDVFGPFEVLSSAGYDVTLATFGEPGPIRTMRGVQLVVEQAAGPCDGIVVPGGGWLNRAERGAWAEAQRGELPARLAAVAGDVPWLASVCSGGMLLATAGLLRDRPATTNPGCYEEFAPLVGRVVDERVVDDGDRITAGALMCGIDLALWIVEREIGTERADMVSHGLSHQRQSRVWRSGRPSPAR